VQDGKQHWCIIKAIKMLAAHCLFITPLPIQSAVAKAENKVDLIQDGSKYKRNKDIDHHHPKHIPIVCHLREPSHFTLVPTFSYKHIFKSLPHTYCFPNKNLRTHAEVHPIIN
jgi:hypothetical protein